MKVIGVVNLRSESVSVTFFRRSHNIHHPVIVICDSPREPQHYYREMIAKWVKRHRHLSKEFQCDWDTTPAVADFEMLSNTSS